MYDATENTLRNVLGMSRLYINSRLFIPKTILRLLFQYNKSLAMSNFVFMLYVYNTCTDQLLYHIFTIKYILFKYVIQATISFTYPSALGLIRESRADMGVSG